MAAGFMTENPLAGFDPKDMSKENYEKFDFHRPYIDEIVLRFGKRAKTVPRTRPD